MAMQSFWNPNEQVDLDQNTGQYVQQPPPQLQPPQNGNAQFLAELEQRYGIKAGETDLANLNAKNPEDVAGFKSALDTQFQQRASSNGGGQQTYSVPQNATPTQQWNAQPSAMQGQSDALFKLLMERATQGTAVDRNDPNIRAQVDPVVAQQERASRNYLDDLAERSGPLANLQGERRLAAERSGQAAGAFESEVIGREMAGRRDEIMQALQLYGNRLTVEQQLAMQQELAQLNASLQRESFGIQRDELGLRRDQMGMANDQFLRELALREWMAGDSSDRAWAGFGV